MKNTYVKVTYYIASDTFLREHAVILSDREFVIASDVRKGIAKLELKNIEDIMLIGAERVEL